MWHSTIAVDITRKTICDTSVIRAVIDTNVLVAALRSASGASYQIVLAADRRDFEIALSVPLLTEYDDVTSRPGIGIALPYSEVEAIVNRLAQVSHHQIIYYLWRPLLAGPKDDMVLELAVAAGVSHIVTFNKKDLGPANEFGITLVQPSEFLPLIS